MPFCELSLEALEDLQLVRDFIALDNVEAAERVIDQFFEGFEQLARFPKTGHTRTDLASDTKGFLNTAKPPLLRAYTELMRDLENGWWATKDLNL